MKINMLSDYLKETYGTKVYKLSLQSGCSCPNRDGTLSYGGCIFCSEGGSGDFAAPLLPLDEQLRLAKARISAKLPKHRPSKEARYIAYFQSYTNTYGPVERLEALYREALMQPDIVALSLGTRPDCLPEEMISMLSRLRKESGKEIWIELGLQSIHEKTAARIHRGYPLSVFQDAYQRLKAADFTVIVHVILGFPWETRAEMLETVRFLSTLQPALDGIKLQLLHVLRGTELGRLYEEAPFPTLTLEDYCSLVVDCLRLLPSDIVVHRITGDGPKRLLLAPLWSADKKHVLNTLTRAIREA
ncbi:MAG TPA: TIGR01212 family radical SAM protein [Oribacterium sp.]|nr:TIGR01212 family radical SAM protein [Oribacterium sp.]